MHSRVINNPFICDMAVTDEVSIAQIQSIFCDGLRVSVCQAQLLGSLHGEQKVRNLIHKLATFFTCLWQNSYHESDLTSCLWFEQEKN